MQESGRAREAPMGERRQPRESRVARGYSYYSAAPCQTHHCTFCKQTGLPASYQDAFLRGANGSRWRAG